MDQIREVERPEIKAYAAEKASKHTVRVQEVDQIQEVEQTQEVDQMQEVERPGIKAYATEDATKHMVLHHKAPWVWIAMSLHVVVPWIGKTSFDGTIIVRTNGVPRMGVG